MWPETNASIACRFKQRCLSASSMLVGVCSSPVVQGSLANKSLRSFSDLAPTSTISMFWWGQRRASHLSNGFSRLCRQRFVKYCCIKDRFGNIFVENSISDKDVYYLTSFSNIVQWKIYCDICFMLLLFVRWTWWLLHSGVKIALTLSAFYEACFLKADYKVNSKLRKSYVDTELVSDVTIGALCVSGVWEAGNAETTFLTADCSSCRWCNWRCSWHQWWGPTASGVKCICCHSPGGFSRLCRDSQVDW